MMTENDYIKATNRTKVSAALTILQDVLAGDDWGITKSELSNIVEPLQHCEKRLFASYELIVDGPF